MKAGIVGTGWMAAVHTEALRRIGVDVVGMVGSTPERTRSKANPLLPAAVRLDRRAARRARSSTAVHITSPNDVHAEQARAAIAAGKHVVCEKPLGVDAAETAELVALAADAGVVNAVCFNLRHFPHNQHAAALVKRWGDRPAAPDQRPLPAGLAAPRHGLELAPRCRTPGQAARRRGHRLALA